MLKLPAPIAQTARQTLQGLSRLPALLTGLARDRALLRATRPAGIALVLVLAYLFLLHGTVASALADWRYPPPKKNLGTRLVQVFNPNVGNKHPQRDAAFRRYQQQGYWLLLLPFGLLLYSAPPALRQRRANVDALSATVMRADDEPTMIANDSADLGYIGEAQRYRLDKLLASGGAGMVYLGFDTRLERRVAVKKLLGHLADDEAMLARFRTEALSLAQLNHPRIVQVYDLLQARGAHWLVMEWMTGGTLAEKIHHQGKLDATTAVPIARALADALAEAHRKGIVHRDIKPDNILFDASGRPKLTDFGIARSARNTLKTQVGLIIGSPGYMSPEQAAGEVTSEASDLYSLGVTLFEMLAGRLPFTGDATQVLMCHISQTPPELATLEPELPAALCQLVQSMLAKSPAQRPTDMATVVAQLDALAQG